jgi:hypothetical protein
MVIRTVKALKERIANAVTLYTPRWDEPMHVFCDAAPSRGCGMMLGQWGDTADLHHGEELAHQDNSEQKLPENTIPPAPLDENGKPRQGAFVPLCFASKSLDPEKHGKWDTAEAECYAIVLAPRKFAPWLLGSKVIVHSDHSGDLSHKTRKTDRNLGTIDFHCQSGLWGVAHSNSSHQGSS